MGTLDEKDMTQYLLSGIQKFVILSMVMSHFSICLKAFDLLLFIFQNREISYRKEGAVLVDKLSALVQLHHFRVVAVLTLRIITCT